MKAALSIALVALALMVGTSFAATRAECSKMAGDMQGDARKQFMHRCTNPESLLEVGRPKRDVQDGYYWSVIGPAEKANIARAATQSLGGSYSPVEMAACLQTFYKRPAPDHLMRQEIAAIAIGCHAQLR